MSDKAGKWVQWAVMVGINISVLFAGGAVMQARLDERLKIREQIAAYQAESIAEHTAKLSKIESDAAVRKREYQLILETLEEIKQELRHNRNQRP